MTDWRGKLNHGHFNTPLRSTERLSGFGVMPHRRSWEGIVSQKPHNGRGVFSVGCRLAFFPVVDRRRIDAEPFRGFRERETLQEAAALDVLAQGLWCPGERLGF